MHFEKISYDNWKEWFDNNTDTFTEKEIINFYNNIQLPKASSQYAAGHDFYCPIPIYVSSTPILIPTGIRWVTEEGDLDKVLIIAPRSGLGVKFGLRLRNTIGIIDADYCLSNNEGHIMASVSAEKEFFLGDGDRFVQGIVLPYYRCGEASNQIRNGGFGSTGE